MRNTLRKSEFVHARVDMYVTYRRCQICTPEAMSPLCYRSLLLLLLSMAPASGGEHVLSAAEKQELLDAHNYLRSTAIPPATNMERMEWDPELAEIAQQYAQLCIFDHNPYRSALSQRFSYVGENIAITNNPVANFTALTEGWYNERLFYDIMSCQCMEKECLHYTQIVWANSAWMGCGAYKCDRAIGFSHPDSWILVCNYGPGGNIVGESPYQIGSPPCSSCPREKSYCWNSLCASSL